MVDGSGPASTAAGFTTLGFAAPEVAIHDALVSAGHRAIAVGIDRGGVPCVDLGDVRLARSRERAEERLGRGRERDEHRQLRGLDVLGAFSGDAADREVDGESSGVRRIESAQSGSRAKSKSERYSVMACSTSTSPSSTSWS